MTVGKNQGRLSTPDIVSHLQENDYFVAKTTKPEDQTSIDFVRRLYDLNLGEGEDVDFIKVNEALDCSADEIRNDSRSLQLTPQDSSLRDALIRHLECCLDKTDDEYAIPISNDALEALRGLWSDQNAWNAPKSYSNRRPTWDAILQANYIERCINQIYKKSADHFLVRATPPEHIFDRLQFHLKLASIRDSPSTKQSGEAQTLNEPVASPPVMLPIDEYEPQIIETIKQNRVTIIHGETGCGKSSRLPIMLLNAPPPDASLAHVKFFISQPRRIAAKGLVERVRSCEPAHKDRFALRMGHGWKEYETNRTRVWFVTTGYLVRLLANHPEKFNDCSHLVVDEVHERSVDTDILCLLCRRLLNTNKKIRLVLMSATLATKLYKDYFGVPNEPIHVGVRRFPIREYFLEDLHKDNFGLPKGEKAAVSAIIKEIESKKCRVAPTSAEMEKRFNLVARLTTIVGEPGASVLVFVPGMAEIVAISEAVDNIHVAGVEYKCFPIHSDVPFEEQMCAFDDPAENEVKVIIAVCTQLCIFAKLSVCTYALKSSHLYAFLSCCVSCVHLDKCSGKLGYSTEC
jgi:HrpA-like RNA helicase